MANIIRFVCALFWAAAAGFIGFLAYVVIGTEHDPRLLFAWLGMCGLALLSATWLSYNIIFGCRSKPGRHDQRL